MTDLIARIQQLAELIGPNVYLQAAIIAAAFIIVGKIADWVISGIIGRIANKSVNEYDDRFVALVHRPVFLSFVLLGLALATRRMGISASPEFITIGVLKTIAIFVWFSTLSNLMKLLVEVFSRTKDSKIVQTGMLSLLHNVMKIVVVAPTPSHTSATTVNTNPGRRLNPRAANLPS